MGLWSKVKGVFGRIGSGIKKGFNWLTQNKDKISNVANAVNDATGGKLTGAIDTATNIYNKASNIL